MKHLLFVFILLLPMALFAQLNDSTLRVVKMEGAVNFRDIGAYKTKDGKEVKLGKIYRSADISKLTDKDIETMLSRHIYTVIDFRGTKESALAPDRLLPNTDYTLCPAGSDSLPDAKQMANLLKEGNFLITMYNNKSVRYYGARYKPLFQKLLTLPETDSSILYHCTGGRDRTGMATALILYSLNVPMDIIEADFVASNIYLKNFNEKMYSQISNSFGIDKQEIEDKFMLRPQLLQSFFASISDQYGSIENFMQEELGVGTEELVILKNKYTE